MSTDSRDAAGAGGARGAGRAGSPPAGDAGPLLEVRGLTKRFGDVLALDGVDFTCGAGELHAVLGENGAGKSTLMHVVSGLYAADAGAVRFAGRDVRWSSPQAARAAGIAMVHQHFMLVPTLTIAENLALARGVRGWIARARNEAETRRLAARYRLEVGDVGRRVEELSVGDRQRVEILKALVAIGDATGDGRADASARIAVAASRDSGAGEAAIATAARPRLLILDEPTAVLAPAEVEALFELLRGLAHRGVGIAIVTHKLAEVVSLADRVTVLRGGRVLAAGRAADYDERALAGLMVGAADEAATAAATAAEGAAAPAIRRTACEARAAAPVLVARDLVVHDAAGARLLDDVSLAVAAGEILAIAGVEGNGQRELVAALAGVADGRGMRREGQVRVAGVDIASAADARAAGLAVVPGDRLHDGMVGELAAWENLLLARDRLAEVAPRGVLRRSAAIARARAAMREFAVQPPDPRRPAAAFSGGNQQRLVAARELGRAQPAAVIAANPTRGLDLAATAAVRRRLVDLARGGAAVVLLSTDLDEVLALGDRTAVLYRGRLVEPDVQPASRAVLGRLMAGAEAA